MKTFRFAAIGFALLSLATAAVAQTQRLPTGITPTGQPTNATGVGILVAPAGGVTGKGKVVSSDNPLPVAGTFSASFTSFTPLGAAVLAAGTASTRVALPTGPNYVLTNNGSVDLFYLLGSSSVTALTTSFSLPAGRSIVVTNGVNTNIAAITASGSTSLTITGGTGTPVISGGGGTGGGGGGDASAANQATQITAANLTNTEIGPVGASACATDNGSCALNELAKRGNQRLTSILTALGSPFQAGGSIGNTSFAISGTLPAFGATPTFNCGTGCAGAATAQGAASAGVTGALQLGLVETAVGTRTNGTVNGISINPANGGIRLDIGTQGTGSTFNPPAGGAGLAGYLSGLYQVATDATPAATNPTQIAGNTILTGNGPTGTGSQRVTVASDNTPIPTKVPATTTGGATPYHAISAASTNSTLISTGAHTLYALSMSGLNTSVGWVRIYDTAAAPTCSSTTGAKYSFPVIGSATAVGGQNFPIPAQGIAFASGLAYCITGGSADNDNTSGPAGIALNAAYN